MSKQEDKQPEVKTESKPMDRSAGLVMTTIEDNKDRLVRAFSDKTVRIDFRNPVPAGINAPTPGEEGPAFTIQ